MSLPLESYALLGDTQSAALVSNRGSIDWLAFPRFDSPACFAALIGTAQNGHWSIAPIDAREVTRQYHGTTLIVETTFVSASGTAVLIDCMAIERGRHHLLRVVRGVAGSVDFELTCCPRFDYGSIVPWIMVDDGVVTAIAGPDALALRSPVPLVINDGGVHGTFSVSAGRQYGFSLTYYSSHQPTPEAVDIDRAVDTTAAWWSEWSSSCVYAGPYRDAVVRSLLTLKALTYGPSGAIVAAPTTSLPELIGGVRNWDYRFCWLRDATFTILALLNAGYSEEASAFTAWLLRAVAGDPSQVQIMYGVLGERRLHEFELEWLPGYAGSRPVRVGNAAYRQFQLDVYGEVIDALWQAIRAGMAPHPSFWGMLRRLLDYVAIHWSSPAENGMWEVRGQPRHFTHSKVMAWVAFDRAVLAAEAGAFEGPVEVWRSLRERIHADVLLHGYDPKRNTFTQSYGSDELDASLLLIPAVGFLPFDDERVRGTIAAIERELYVRPFVRRYSADKGRANVDGLPGDEGAFLACSFWLVDAYALTGRLPEARALFEELLLLRNDVGLLSEEYAPAARMLVGNFPQAFSHLALVNSAYNIARFEASPSAQRADPTAAIPSAAP